MEPGHVKLLICGGVVVVAGAIFMFMEMQNNPPAAPAKSTLTASNAPDEDVAHPVDVFGAPVPKADDTVAPSTDLGFGSADPMAKPLEEGMTSAVPEPPLERKTQGAETPRIPAPPSPFSGQSLPGPVRVETMPVAVPEPTPTPEPNPPSQVSEEKPLQRTPKSVILKAIVRIDSDTVAYISVDGTVKGYREASSIGGSITVKKIMDDGVTFECIGKTVTLSVGGQEDI